MDLHVFIGGMLIRRFDGFRRLCRRAAEEYGHPLSCSDSDLLLANRTLAALGGPPATTEVRGRFEQDGLPLMLLFLLTQEIECRIGLLGDTEWAMGRLKSLVHLFSHAAYPMLTGQPPLSFQAVVRELGPSTAVLRPVIRYDRDGEPIGAEPEGAAGLLRTGPEGGPYHLAVLIGPGAGPAPLLPKGEPIHPAVLILP